MLFKSAIIYRMRSGYKIEQATLAEHLESVRFSPIVGHQETSRGFICPIEHSEEEELVYCQGEITLLCYQNESKILPRSVLLQELEERVKEHEKNTGYRVKSAEKKRMLDQIVMELLPKAFTKTKRVLGYIDHGRDEIVIGSSSAQNAEDFLGILRMGLGSLPVTPIRCNTSPIQTMTSWAQTQELPQKLALGREITMVDEVNEGSTGAFKRQDLGSDEIGLCIESGKKVQKVALAWNDFIQFSIDQRMILTKMAPMDMLNDDGNEYGDGTDYPRIAADLYLTSAGLRQLIPELYGWFDAEDVAGTIETEEAAEEHMRNIAMIRSEQGKLAGLDDSDNLDFSQPEASGLSSSPDDGAPEAEEEHLPSGEEFDEDRFESDMDDEIPDFENEQEGAPEGLPENFF